MAEVNCQASDRLDYGDGDCINANPTWAFPRLTGSTPILTHSERDAKSSTGKATTFFSSGRNTMVDLSRDPRLAQKPPVLQKVRSDVNKLQSLPRFERYSDSPTPSETTLSSHTPPKLSRESTPFQDSPVDPSQDLQLATRAIRKRQPKTVRRISRAHHISWIGGEVQRLPYDVLNALNSFCTQQNSTILPCTSNIWPDSKFRSGNTGKRRSWVTVPDGEEVMIGRFSYGEFHQFLVAKCRLGSYWELGVPVIIVPTSSGKYKVWRGQEAVADIPEQDAKITCRFLDVETPRKVVQPVRWIPQLRSGEDSPEVDSKIHPSRRDRVLSVSGLSKEADNAIQDQRSWPQKSPDRTQQTLITDDRDASPRSSPRPALSTIMMVAPNTSARSDRMVIPDKADPEDRAPSKAHGIRKRSRDNSLSSSSDTLASNKAKRARLPEARLRSSHNHDEDELSLVYEDVFTAPAPSYVSAVNLDETSTTEAASGASRTLVAGSARELANNNELHNIGSPVSLLHSEQHAFHKTASDLIWEPNTMTSTSSSRGSVNPESVTGNQGKDAKLEFDLASTKIFFADAENDIADESDFAEIKSCVQLFNRAYVVDIVARTTQLLDVKVGGKTVRVQKDFVRDFEKLKITVVSMEATEIVVRNGD